MTTRGDARRSRPSAGLRLRTYPDGVVVYVPSTCETHLLPPAFASLFDTTTFAVGNPGDNARRMSSPGPIEPSAEHLDELVRLKIFELIP